MARQVGKKAISEDDRKNALARIKPAEKYDAFSGCDLVIETATEKEEVKRKILGELCSSLKSDAILATNTSSISITRLASSTDRPERFIGIHFMREIEPRIGEDVFTVLSVDRSVKSRTSFGGTAPKNVRSQAKKWLRKLEKEKS